MPVNPRARRWSAWRWARLGVRGLALAVYLVLFVLVARRGLAAAPLRLPFLVDPLFVAAASLSARRLVAGGLLALIVIALTLVFGRAWCGWLCPVGITLDLLSIRPKRTGPRTLPDRLRWLKHFVLISLLTMAVLGSTLLLILDPLVLATRTLAVAVWPALSAAFTASESFLYRVPFLQGPLVQLETTLRSGVLPDFQPFYRLNLVVGLFAIGIVALEGIGSRFWCRSLCPLGALLALESKLALFKRRTKSHCTQCGRCERVCPTGTIAGKSFASDPSECIMCLECARVCPVDAIEFAPSLQPAGRRAYDAGRRELIGGLLGGAALVSLMGASEKSGDQANFLLRPPGALDPGFLEACTHCGECMRACPTSGLQPALWEAGLNGLFSPVLVPRLGYCDYSCNRCGQVCPTGAIPRLALTEKRRWVIGKAFIDMQRCLPWTGDSPCSVCEEMCPRPEKAIYLEEVTVQRPDGSSMQLRRPHVRRELCIGCGICEAKCPVKGAAAIRVYNVGDERAMERVLS